MADLMLVDPPKGTSRKLTAAARQVVRTSEQIREALETDRAGIWIVMNAERLPRLGGVRVGAYDKRSLLLMGPIAHARLAFLGTMFGQVVATALGIQLLPTDVLEEVLADDERIDRFIGGTVDLDDQAVILYRGNLDRLVVPFDAFPIRRGYPAPEFQDFEVIDYGQAIRLGAYEAATEAILYRYDADFRKRDKARHLAQDGSFGGSLKRARLERGLKRSDFAPLEAKTIARIERNETTRPHGETLQTICQRLGMTVEDLETY